MKVPTAIIEKVNWWLQKRFDESFKCEGDKLKHGNQEDATECGIVSVNAVAHDIFNDPLWNPSKKVTERVKWFNSLVESHIAEVREPMIGE
jgi:hypothetical protein